MTRSLFIATPMYGGQCYGNFAASRDNARVLLAEGGISSATWGTADSLVTRSRNDCAAEFLRSGMSDLLFVDADVSFEPEAVRDLLDHPDKEVICGPYPKKEINWALVRDAAKLGFGDEDPKALENFVGKFFFHPAHPEAPHKISDILEVHESGTGFMLIRRHVLDEFARSYPELSYYPDHDLPEARRQKIACFFDTAIVNERYLSEDQNFCRLVTALGMKVWVLPHIQLTHLGYYRFIGNLGAEAAVQEAKMKARQDG
jgi:hypothetical protein